MSLRSPGRANAVLTYVRGLCPHANTWQVSRQTRSRSSAALFLGMSGVEFQILAPNWVFPGIDFSILTSRTPILLAGLGVGLILGVVGNYLKWF